MLLMYPFLSAKFSRIFHSLVMLRPGNCLVVIKYIDSSLPLYVNIIKGSEVSPKTAGLMCNAPRLVLMWKQSCG